MLLIVEKGIRRRVCYSIYRYAKGNNKCNKVYDKIMDLHIFNIGNIYQKDQKLKNSKSLQPIYITKLNMLSI